LERGVSKKSSGFRKDKFFSQRKIPGRERQIMTEVFRKERQGCPEMHAYGMIPVWHLAPLGGKTDECRSVTAILPQTHPCTWRRTIYIYRRAISHYNLEMQQQRSSQELQTSETLAL